MKVLVVGGAGYIGSVTVEHLLRKGHHVTIFDNLSRGHSEAIPSESQFIRGDIGSEADLDAAFAAAKPDAVMHFAALIQVGESVEHPALYFQNNVVNSVKLIDSMLRNNVRNFVFSSTAAVYGEPPTSPIDEDFPLVPTSPYGDSKLALEKILKWYANAYDMRYTSLRYFNACGATEERGEDHHPESHLIPIILQVARGLRKEATIYGDDYPTPDGTCIRDYIHVSDLAEAHALAMEHMVATKRSGVYNLGSEQGFSVKEVIETVRRVTGHPIPVVVGPRRPGDPAVLVASSKRIKQEIGWNPTRTDLATIISDAWKWHQKHPNGYKLEAAPHV
jgi:UDP-glucose 4-epimerase